jgi:ribonuclease-3
MSPVKESKIYKLLRKYQQMNHEPPSRLMAAIDYHFVDTDLLLEALTHSSAARDIQKRSENQEIIPWNERLEFLGDSVLSLTISTHLLQRPEQHAEGTLSKIRANLVSEPALASIGRELNLGQYLILSPGEIRGGGRHKESVIADAVEALFGAVYLDGGYAAAERVILGLFADKLTSRLTDLIEKDYKSRLQELTQGWFKEAPQYRVINRTGPDHQASFKVQVEFRGLTLGRGHGTNKKAASQAAAQQALQRLEENPRLFKEGTS